MFLWQKFAGFVCLPGSTAQPSKLTENNISSRLAEKMFFGYTYAIQTKQGFFSGKYLLVKKSGEN